MKSAVFFSLPLAALLLAAQPSAYADEVLPSQTFSVVPGTVLRVDSQSSGNWSGPVNLRITAWNKPFVQLTQHLRQSGESTVSTQVTQNGNALHVQAVFAGPMPHRRGFLGWLGVSEWDAVTATYDIDVPAEMPLRFETSNGDATISGLDAPIDGTTSNGDIIASNIANARVSLRSSNGDVTVSLETASDPQVDLTTSNGDIHFSVPASFDAPVRAETSNGEVTNPFKDAHGPGSVVLETSNGDIDVKTSN